jgi:hypothetical protein
MPNSQSPAHRRASAWSSGGAGTVGLGSNPANTDQRLSSELSRVSRSVPLAPLSFVGTAAWRLDTAGGQPLSVRSLHSF